MRREGKVEKNCSKSTYLLATPVISRKLPCPRAAFAFRLSTRLKQDMSKKFRVVNRTLGVQPKIGPFSTEQVFPWACILMGNVLIFYYTLKVNWLATGFITFWGWGTWWILSSNKDFFGKFISTPRITRGYIPFSPLNKKQDSNSQIKSNEKRR